MWILNITNREAYVSIGRESFRAIGQGAFGTVSLVEDQHGFLALKAVSKAAFGGDGEALGVEMGILSTINLANVPNLMYCSGVRFKRSTPYKLLCLSAPCPCGST